MTIQSDYTPEEWDVLLRAPVFATIFIIQADAPGPAVAYLKILMALRVIIETAHQEGQSELVAAVTAAVLAGQRPNDLATLPRTLSEARQMMLDNCRQAAALLAQKAPSAEADAYSRWLMLLSARVAGMPTGNRAESCKPPTCNEKTRHALAVLAAALDAA